MTAWAPLLQFGLWALSFLKLDFCQVFGQAFTHKLSSSEPRGPLPMSYRFLHVSCASSNPYSFIPVLALECELQLWGKPAESELWTLPARLTWLTFSHAFWVTVLKEKFLFNLCQLVLMLCVFFPNSIKHCLPSIQGKKKWPVIFCQNLSLPRKDIL